MSVKFSFVSDYQEGACPEILKRLSETNLKKTAGYGEDEYSEEARKRIREKLGCPEAEIHFLVGGTQTNRVVIDALLRPWQGVMAAETGHIALHEAGAIEAGGHKVLTLPAVNGKVRAEDIREMIEVFRRDDSREHMVEPGMLYLSQPTELGTLYSLKELEALHALCLEYEIPLFVDGARLAYALGCPENDVTLPDLAALTDAFYIGGTKCGALFGEAVVFPRKGRAPHFFTMVKQHGALVAKGRITGLQFETLFTDGLYEKLGEHAVKEAMRIREVLREKGIRLAYPSPTNQTFVLLSPEEKERLSGIVEMAFWEEKGTDTVMRICTSWASDPEEVDRFLTELKG